MGSSRLPQWGCPGHVQMDIGNLDLLILSFCPCSFTWKPEGTLFCPRFYQELQWHVFPTSPL